MKLRILLKGGNYHVQKKGLFFWHTLVHNMGKQAVFFAREDAQDFYAAAVENYTRILNARERAKHKPVIIAQQHIRPTLPDAEAMRLLEEKAKS